MLVAVAAVVAVAVLRKPGAAPDPAAEPKRAPARRRNAEPAWSEAA